MDGIEWLRRIGADFTHRALGCGVVVVLATGLAFLTAWGGGALAKAPAPGDEGPAELDSPGTSVAPAAQVNQALDLYDSTLVRLDLGDKPQAGIRLTVPIEGHRYTLDLQPQSVRAPNYQLKVQMADGSYVEAEPGAVRTLRGHVVGIENSAVAASWEADGLHARIFFSDSEQFWLQPVASKIPNAPADQYVLYRNDDIITPEKTCGLDGMLNPFGDRGDLPDRQAMGGAACGPRRSERRRSRCAARRWVKPSSGVRSSRCVRRRQRSTWGRA